MKRGHDKNRFNRRTVLKQLGMGAASLTAVSTNTTAAESPQHSAKASITATQGDIVFSDGFDDGNLAWTTVENQDWWSEKGGKLHFNPGTSAGDAGNNHLYADATYNGDQGLLEWPLAIEVKGYASDTSASLGAWAASGGVKDGRGTPRLGVADSAYTGQGDFFTVWNSEGQRFDIGTARSNNTWYTYRLVPDLSNNVINVSRNGQSWTVPEPGNNPIGNTSIDISGVTCWGCGGNGDRQYEYIKVWNMEVDDDGDDDDGDDDDGDDDDN